MRVGIIITGSVIHLTAGRFSPECRGAETKASRRNTNTGPGTFERNGNKGMVIKPTTCKLVSLHGSLTVGPSATTCNYTCISGAFLSLYQLAKYMVLS